MKIQEINIDDYIINSNVTKDDLNNIVKSISMNEVILNEVLMLLEPYFISTDTQKRLRAVRFLTSLISNFNVDYLTDLEITYLSKFLRSKLDDHYTIAPAVLPGLDFLIKCKNSSDDEKLNLIKSLLREIHVQSLVQSDRYLVYSTFNYILSTAQTINLIKTNKFESDFVYGFIQSMDSEKDPRNLVLCFKCITLICKNLDVTRFVEELFEVFSCYFPIDFTPPADDPNGITKDELVSLLRSCISATPLFAKFAIPLLLDKLDSDIDSARLDSLLTYVECAKVYDAGDYKDYIEQLWNNFQKLAMSTTSIQIEEASLKAIEYLTLNISKSVQIENTLLSVDTFIDKCIQCCIIYLKDADLKLVWPSAKCLLAISNSTETAFILIIKSLLGFLIEQYSQPNNQLNQKKIYLELLNKFLSNGQKFSQQNACVYIVEARASILNICYEILNSSAFKQHLEPHALSLIECLVRYKNVLKTIDCEFLLKQMLNYELRNDNREQILRIVLVIINEYENLFDYTFEFIQKKFEGSRREVIQILSLFSQLNINSSKLNFKLETLISNDLAKHSNLLPDLVNIYKNLVNFNQIYESSNENKELFSQNLFKFLNFLLNHDNLVNQSELVVRVSYLIQIYASKLESKAAYQDVFNMIYKIIEKYYSFELSSLSNQINMLHILMQFICSLNNQIFSAEIKDSFLKFHKDLFSLALLHPSESANLLAVQFYASLINKIQDDNLINEVLDEAFIKKLIDPIQLDFKEKYFQLWVWLTKALLLREHKKFELFMNKLLDWLDDENLTVKSSQAFYVLLNDYDDVLRRDKNNANVKLFYKQRFFNFVIQKLKDKFNSKDDQRFKISYVTALSSTLRFLPRNIIQQQLPTMLPMLVYSLSNNQGDDNLWLCSLKSLEDLIIQTTSATQTSIRTSDNCLIEYLSEILQKLFQLSKYQGNMEIRILALNCILKITNLKANILIKYQRDVVKNLEPCLNDKKRLVRQKAVLARNKWYLLTTKDE